MVKRLHAGQAARNGVYGALLARRGFTGILNVLEAPFGGFFSAMTAEHDAAALTAGIGTQWKTLAVGFKPYATAGAIHAALMLLDTIMRDEELTADRIERIEVECTTYCKGHVGWPYVPQGVASAQINMYYALAVMALDRAAMIEQFREERLADPRILAFIRRIRVETDPQLDAMGNAYRYATRLNVLTKAGARHKRETLYRPGSADSPLSDERLREKFELLACYALPTPAVQQIGSVVGTLERCPSMTELASLLGSSSRGRDAADAQPSGGPA